MAVFVNLNLGCVQPGEGHFRNLTTLRSHLTLAEGNRVALKGFLVAGRRMRGIRERDLLRCQLARSGWREIGKKTAPSGDIICLRSILAEHR
jgi:hypothetical protein